MYHKIYLDSQTKILLALKLKLTDLYIHDRLHLFVWLNVSLYWKPTISRIGRVDLFFHPNQEQHSIHSAFQHTLKKHIF